MQSAIYNAYYKNVDKVEQTGDREVTFIFTMKGNRELPLITGQLPVLPKHWWDGKDANGKQRDIASRRRSKRRSGLRPLQVAVMQARRLHPA